MKFVELEPSVVLRLKIFQFLVFNAIGLHNRTN